MNLKHAFTTVELLLATVLSAIMMIGVLRVVGSIRPHLTHGPPPTSNWSNQLLDLLRWDLTNARTIWQEHNKLTLVGYDALDRRDFGWRRGSSESSLHHPVQVEYYLWSSVKGQTWLLRRQIHTTDLTNRNAWSEVVARDVQHFEIRPPISASSFVENSATELWLDQPVPVPDQIKLFVQLADGDTEIDRLMIIR